MASLHRQRFRHENRSSEGGLARRPHDGRMRGRHGGRELVATLCLATIPSAAGGVIAAGAAFRAVMPHTCGCGVVPWALAPPIAVAVVTFVAVLTAGIVALTAMTWVAVPVLRRKMMLPSPDEASDEALAILDAVTE